MIVLGEVPSDYDCLKTLNVRFGSKAVSSSNARQALLKPTRFIRLAIGRPVSVRHFEPYRIHVTDAATLRLECGLNSKPKGLAVTHLTWAAGHSTGTVPPSIRCSDPEIEAARGDARKAMRSATS